MNQMPSEYSTETGGQDNYPPQQQQAGQQNVTNMTGAEVSHTQMIRIWTLQFENYFNFVD